MSNRPVTPISCCVGLLFVLLAAAGAQADESPTSPTLNERIDGLAASLAGREGASARELSALLGTLSGRAALLEVLETVEEEERAKTAVTIFERMREEAGDDDFRRRCRERKEDVTKLGVVLRAVADKLQGESAVEDDVRAFLRRDDAADVLFDAWIRERRDMDAWKIVRDHTRLGRSLAGGGQGKVVVNKHAVWELDDLLVRLRRRADQRSRLLDSVAAGGDAAVRAELARWAIAEAPDLEVDALGVWSERLRGATVEEEVDALRKRESAIAKELDATGYRLHVDLEALAYQVEGLDLLRSSIFYNPRTRAGRYYYTTEFEDHFAARMFGTWGWNAKVSKGPEDLVQRLRARKEGLQGLARTHDKIIVHISGMPPWLSRSDDPGSFEAGGWSNKEAHPPKDIEVWRHMVRELALMFREVDGVERYYEFWNEPDLKYWQGSVEDFLSLYGETAKVIRETDPEGKIGGCAVNQWPAKIHKTTGSDVLNYELIRYARANDLPLDFVSWHHFGRPVAAIREAKEAYEAELRRVGYEAMPEFLVTEWSYAGRGTPYANVFMAEMMLGFFEAGVDVQTASCWEEFHAKPNPKHFPPWGLMTQQAYRKNAWHVHQVFDRAARGSKGVAIVRPSDRRTLVLSKKEDGTYDVLAWERGTAPRLQAAWESLKDAGLERKEMARRYRVGDRLERALAEGEPPGSKWAEAWKAAKRVYDEHPVQTSRLTLRFDGAEAIAVLSAEVVRMGREDLDVAVVGNELAFPFGPQEFVWIRLRRR